MQPQKPKAKRRGSWPARFQQTTVSISLVYISIVYNDSVRFLGRAVRARLLRSGADHFGDVPEMGPPQVVLLLAAVQTVAEPDAPDDVEVGAEAGHNVPVVMLATVRSLEEKQEG